MRIKYFIFSLLTVLLFNYCSVKPTEPDIEEKVEAILSQLTLKEKVDLCHAQSKFSSKGVARLGIPELWMSDGPHGVRAEISWDSWSQLGQTNDSCTAFPALTCLAATFNEELSFKYGKAIGEEARYRRKDILLAPGINIYRTPLNGRNFEYMGEDPHLASKLVVPYIKGVQENGVAACVKHFALNNQEKWRGHINVNVSERALREIYLPAQKAAVIEGKTWAIMGAYNKFRGQHCCHNEYLNNKILKGEWGFDGVFISDWGAVHNTDEAALYGMDLEMGTWTNGLTHSEARGYENYFLGMPFYNKLKSGEIPVSVVDDKARRILRLMYRTSLSENRPWGSFATKEHFNIAREISQEGIVLLKNENNFFPINPDEKLKIAVIGQNATHAMTVGGGSSELKTKYEISPLEGIKTRFKNAEILYAMGYEAYVHDWQGKKEPKLNAEQLKKEAIAVAKTADVVLFIGGLNKYYFQDSEGADREIYNLAYNQNQLIDELKEANANLGIVIITGNAYAMPWLDKVDGVIQSWYLGSEAGNALADVISGDINPSGKLPFTYPVKLEDNAAHHFGEISYPGDSIDQYYEEGIYVGYRWHEKKDIKPLFAFGYGLSYSSFTIRDCKISKTKFKADETIEINATVSNTSSIKGGEVVQVYIGKKDSKIDRAIKELKGFKKVFVDGNSNTQAKISFKASDLKYWNEEQNGWDLEKGEYFAAIGNSSDNIIEEITFTIE